MRHIKITKNLYLNELVGGVKPENFKYSILEICLFEKKFKFKKNNFNTSKKLFTLTSKPYQNSEEINIFDNDILRPSSKYIFTCVIYAFMFYFLKNKNPAFKKFAKLIKEENIKIINIKKAVFDRKYRLNHYEK